jgi:hypothetical protein
LLLFLGLGLATTLAVAWSIALFADVSTGRTLQGEALVDDERWTVTRTDRAGAAQIRSVRVRALDWSPQQAAGAPDTPTVGDQVTAWAPAQSDGGTEWLILEYATAVVPREVHVYQSCAPGALFKVGVLDADGNEHEAWSGDDPFQPNKAGIGIAKIPVKLDVTTNRVKLYLACDKVPGWNEVDAVALVSDRGESQWARRVRASSTYAARSASPPGAAGNPELLMPRWADVARPGVAYESGEVNREERVVDARGWPLLALWSETDTLGPQGQTARAAYQRRQLGASADPGFVESGVPSGTIALTTPAGGAGSGASLPLRPIWVGVGVNSAVFGAAWLGAWSVLVIPRRFFREVGRMRRGACVACGYDLGYDFVRGCPECGWRRDVENVARRAAVAVNGAENEEPLGVGRR